MHAMATADVVHLAQIEAERFEQKGHSLSRGRPFLGLFVRSPVQMLLVGVIAWILDSTAADLRRRALIFRGARARLREQPVEPGQSVEVGDELLAALDKAARTALDLRRGTLDLNKAMGQRRAGSPVAQALHRLSLSAADFYEELRDFRGALLAREADHSPRLAGRSACTDEELVAVLKKIAADA